MQQDGGSVSSYVVSESERSSPSIDEDPDEEAFKSWMRMSSLSTSAGLTLVFALALIASASMMVFMASPQSVVFFLCALNLFINSVLSIRLPLKDNPTWPWTWSFFVSGGLAMWTIILVVAPPSASSSAEQLAKLQQAAVVRTASYLVLGFTHRQMPYRQTRCLLYAALFAALSFAAFSVLYTRSGDAYASYVHGWAGMAGPFACGMCVSFLFERYLIRLVWRWTTSQHITRSGSRGGVGERRGRAEGQWPMQRLHGWHDRFFPPRRHTVEVLMEDEIDKQQAGGGGGGIRRRATAATASATRSRSSL